MNLIAALIILFCWFAFRLIGTCRRKNRGRRRAEHRRRRNDRRKP